MVAQVIQEADCASSAALPFPRRGAETSQGTGSAGVVFTGGVKGNGLADAAAPEAAPRAADLGDQEEETTTSTPQEAEVDLTWYSMGSVQSHTLLAMKW